MNPVRLTALASFVAYSHRNKASFVYVPKALVSTLHSGIVEMAEEALRGGNPGSYMGPLVREVGKLLKEQGLSKSDLDAFVSSLFSYVEVHLNVAQIEVPFEDMVLDSRLTGRIQALLNQAVMDMSYDVNKGANRVLGNISRTLQKAFEISEKEASLLLADILDGADLKFSASAEILGQTLSTFAYNKAASARFAVNLPKTVERYVKEHKEQGMDEKKAWAIAWSRYCKYTNPGSPRCKQDEYLKG